jgi:hypothetical protein
VEETMRGAGGEQGIKEYLDSMGMTMQDLREIFRFNLTLVELAKSEVEYTVDEVKAEFELNPDLYRREYSREYDLTVDEVENLTFEDMQEFLVDKYVTSKAYPMMDPLIRELEAEADIDYVYLPPGERAEMKAEAEKEKAKPEPVEKEEPAPGVTVQEDGSGEEPAPEPEETADEADAGPAGESPEEGATENGSAEAGAPADESRAEGEDASEQEQSDG